MVTEQELSRIIREWILEHGSCTAPIDETVDLIASGALDSMGFIELLAHVESCIGRKLDLLEFESRAFTSIQGLVQNILVAKTAV
ncbi:MAG TPA: hypothetical protein VFS39_14915 [Nitrospira sp.]|nr:hypothetical protein [Nitrospira sp.]